MPEAMAVAPEIQIPDTPIIKPTIKAITPIMVNTQPLSFNIFELS